MAINVSALPEYVEQNTPLLLGKAIMGARSLDYMTMQMGVKSSAVINILTSDVKLADGNGCGFTAAGDDTFTQRVIKTGQIKVNKSFCEKKLLGKWAENLVRIGAGKEVLPFEAEFSQANAQAIAEAIEKCIWQGDTSKGSDNLGRFDGLIKILKGDGGVVDVAIANKTPKFDAVQKVLLAMDARSLEGGRIYASPSFCRAYAQELVTKNLFHHEAGKDYNEYEIPGSQVILTAVEGLEGTETSDYIVGANPKNLFYGCDLMDDVESFDLWYSKDNQEFRLAVKFNAGVQVAFPKEVVLGTIARA